MYYRSSLICAVGALLAMTVPPAVHATADASTLWRDRAADALSADAPQPARWRSLELDLAGMRQLIDTQVPRGASLALPLPEGGYARFVLEDSATLPSELAAKYPQIRSLRGYDEAGHSVRVDISPLGFHAMAFDHDGVWLVQPETPGEGSKYLSFRRSDIKAPGDFRCAVHGAPQSDGRHLLAGPAPTTVTGNNKRNLRVAIAATGEYTARFGGTVAGGLAAITTALNRLNQVYENEFSVHMTLVANNNLLVQTNAGTDPYTNDDGGEMLGENQAAIDAAIGNANYDLGHVFSTGGGGVAYLNSVCDNGDKAGGVTGMGNPVGDPFYIDYVAHEMGHQFGGNHTFNATTEACDGNRESAAAYETGSGSTIMAYAGICGATNDTQNNSDPYFHAKSVAEISARLTAVASCGTSTANPDAAPVITPMNNAYIIPARTAFTLPAPVVTDANGDSLTYAWEEYDLGASTNVGVDNGTSPIIRSFNPSTNASRTVPRLSNLLNNTLAKGEILPQTSRSAMKFRLTVRDNHAGGGRSTSADLPAIQVVGSAGPFALTAPNTALSWSIGLPYPVSWNVASTSSSPIACATVNIMLSKDGGNTWPITLASSTANDGSASVVAPAGSNTTQARVRVQCNGNIFFDLSDVNFSVVTSNDSIFRDGFQLP